MTSTPLEVPTIDIDRDPMLVGKEVDETLRSVGFFQIVNHGVDTDIAETCWTTTRTFFDLPLQAKLESERQPGEVYGYFPIKSESLSQSIEGMAPGDLKESLNAGIPLPAGHVAVDTVEQSLFAPIQWPSALPELRATWFDYMGEMEKLSSRLMSIFALGLGLDADYFVKTIDVAPSALRAINYPAQDTPPEEGQFRAGAHTDYGTLTILRQEVGPGGLQVHDEKSDAWIDIPATEGAYVINIGDLMARWTNDRWTSTLHRVVNPDAESNSGSSRRRQSMPFFHNANYSQVVECLPTCLGPDGTAKYEPVQAGPHLFGKTNKSVVPTMG